MLLDVEDQHETDEGVFGAFRTRDPSYEGRSLRGMRRLAEVERLLLADGHVAEASWASVLIRASGRPSCRPMATTVSLFRQPSPARTRARGS